MLDEPLTHGSLAVRYRPRRFTDLVGQRHVVVPLQRAVVAGTVPHQLLFSGGSGLGKTTVARITAAALLCERPLQERPDGDGCATCASCLDVAAGTHPDVIEIDAASNGRVDEIREIAARAHLAPLRGDRRIYIIDEAHGLSQSGGQAFLKLLEEPPAHVVFMLATTDPDKMLHTNRSRCVQFELLPPSVDDIVEHVVGIAAREGARIDRVVAAEIVRAAPSELGVRGALMSLEKLLPTLRLDPSADAVAALLGTPSSAAVDAVVTHLETGDLPAVVVAYQSLRASFPAAHVVGRIAGAWAARLVADVQHDSVARVRYRVAAATELRTAKRDGSDLGALVAFATICAAAPEPRLATERAAAVVDLDRSGRLTGTTPTLVGHHSKGVNYDWQAVLAEAADSAEASTTAGVDQGPVQATAEPDTVHATTHDNASNPAHDMASDQAEGVPGTEHAPAAAVDDTGYVVDPFTAPAHEPVPAPTQPTDAAQRNAKEALTTLLSSIATAESHRARLLVAKLRPAHPVLRGEVLELHLSVGTVRALTTDRPMLDAAAARVGRTVEVIELAGK